MTPQSVKLPTGVSSIPEEVAPLFQPLQLGRFQLSNRMVYPPLTRCRAPDHVPRPHMAEYYGQRAFEGSLLIAEATVVAPDGYGYPNTPGIYSPEQVEGWKPVTQAVKAKGAVFFNQLWHCGRSAHELLNPNKEPPVSSSPLAITDPAYSKIYVGGTTMVDAPVPLALDEAGIKAKVQAYRTAARNALDAGFDGVEIHGANGYLIDQFTKSNCNTRSDQYGGSIENRCRFALEVVAAVVEEVGGDRVGIRLSPFTDFLGAVDATPYATFTYLVEQLNKFGLAYLHMVESRINGNTELENNPNSLTPFRLVFKGPFIAAGGYKRESGIKAVSSGHSDLVAFGRIWIANPDLPTRFLLNAPLNRYNRDTFYTPGMEGYTDYPTLEQAQATA
ncbi:hypothetical protein QJQ45_026892, partial [Haematococcus lacustris]